MKLQKKIIRREKTISDICKNKNWNVNKLTPYQMQCIVLELKKIETTSQK
jgi:hypothetical protein